MSKRTFFFLIGFLSLALAGSIVAGYWIVSGGRIAGQESAANLIGGPFTLTDETGAAVSNEDLTGHYMLVFFGYTYCLISARRR